VKLYWSKETLKVGTSRGERGKKLGFNPSGSGGAKWRQDEGTGVRGEAKGGPLRGKLRG